VLLNDSVDFLKEFCSKVVLVSVLSDPSTIMISLGIQIDPQQIAVIAKANSDI
jgi:hypothetical protein